MAFGALAAYAFNGPLGIPLVPAVLIAMILTAALRLGSTSYSGDRCVRDAQGS